ncbi:hypothetical protein HG530_015336 [Fusarium avenaceum]|nr:hypothetical protein HG530_015336 [Fusarium avenaceum]
MGVITSQNELHTNASEHKGTSNNTLQLLHGEVRGESEKSPRDNTRRRIGDKLGECAQTLNNERTPPSTHAIGEATKEKLDSRNVQGDNWEKLESRQRKNHTEDQVTSPADEARSLESGCVRDSRGDGAIDRGEIELRRARRDTQKAQKQKGFRIDQSLSHRTIRPSIFLGLLRQILEFLLKAFRCEAFRRASRLGQLAVFVESHWEIRREQSNEYKEYTTKV